MADINGTPIRPESQWGPRGTATTGRRSNEKGPGGSSTKNGSTVSAAATTTERFFQGGSNAEDYRNKPRREILEEHDDGSRLIKARYGANEVIIKDNRNKKKRTAPFPLAPGAQKKKKKKK